MFGRKRQQEWQRVRDELDKRRDWMYGLTDRIVILETGRANYATHKSVDGALSQVWACLEAIQQHLGVEWHYEPETQVLRRVKKGNGRRK